MTRSSTWPRYGEALPGLNLCGAGRVVCLIDPVGDVYACPFAIHDEFLAGNVRERGGFTGVWRSRSCSPSCAAQTGGACRSCSAFDSCRGGCMAAKFFTGLPLDGPDPECVRGSGTGAAGTRTRRRAAARRGRSPSGGGRSLARRPRARRETAHRADRRGPLDVTVQSFPLRSRH